MPTTQIWYGNTGRAHRKDAARCLFAAGLIFAAALPSTIATAEQFAGLGTVGRVVDNAPAELAAPPPATLSLALADEFFKRSTSGDDTTAVPQATGENEPDMMVSPDAGPLWLATLAIPRYLEILGDRISPPGSIRNVDGSRGPDVFGAVAIPTASSVIETLSANALKPMIDSSSVRDCRQGKSSGCMRDAAWVQLVSASSRLDRLPLLERINHEVNSRIDYQTDLAAGLAADHWSSPYETMKRARGDCEDYAILKMWLLAELGVPIHDLHIVVVKSNALRSRHAVLAVRTEEGTYILDSLVEKVRRDRDVHGYEPLFSVGIGGVWIHGKPIRRGLASADPLSEPLSLQ